MNNCNNCEHCSNDFKITDEYLLKQLKKSRKELDDTIKVLESRINENKKQEIAEDINDNLQEQIDFLKLLQKQHPYIYYSQSPYTMKNTKNLSTWYRM